MALTACAVLAGAPAAAQFMDCNSAEFQEGVMPWSIGCEEAFRMQIRLPAGSRTLRVIHDIEWPTYGPREHLEVIRDTVPAIERAMEQIGEFDLTDVTIILADPTWAELFDPARWYQRRRENPDEEPPPFPQPEDDGHPSSWARADTGQALPGACRIWLIPHLSRARAATSVAHEIFHCIQRASLTPDQVAGRAPWWVEGSATWFSGLALPEIVAPGLAGLARDYAQSEAPLYEMDYQAAIFFHWLAGVRGPQSVMAALRQAATSDAEGAQVAMLSSLQDQQAWLNYARAIADGAVPGPTGAPLPTTREPMRRETWGGNLVADLQPDPFVHFEGEMTFECGEWRLDAALVPQHFALVRPDDGGPWQPLPDRVEAIPDPRSFDLVAFNGSDRRQFVIIDGRRERACQDCLGANTVDACLAGTWELAGHNTDALIGFGTTVKQETLSLGSDGRITIASEQTWSHDDVLPGTGEAYRMASSSSSDGSGTWAITATGLAICIETVAGTEDFGIEYERGYQRAVEAEPRTTAVELTYSCEGGGLVTSSDTASGPLVQRYALTEPELETRSFGE